MQDLARPETASRFEDAAGKPAVARQVAMLLANIAAFIVTLATTCVCPADTLSRLVTALA